MSKKVSEMFEDFKKVEITQLKPYLPIQEKPKGDLPIEESQEIDFSTLEKIDFSKLGDSSDLKRLIYLAVFGKTFRGKDRNLERKLNQRLKKMRGS